MEEQNDAEVVEQIEAEVAEQEAAPAEEQDTTDWKAKYEETQARLKRAETKLEKTKIERKAEELAEKKTGELNETQLDYLDLKGIKDDDEIELVQAVMKRTGMTVRQALNDDFTLTKLAGIRKEKELSDATPGSTRRAGGGAINTVDWWFARYEQTGELPKDFKLRSEVINRKVEQEAGNLPAWHLRK